MNQRLKNKIALITGMLRLVEGQQEDRDAAEELGTRRVSQSERQLAGAGS